MKSTFIKFLMVAFLALSVRSLRADEQKFDLKYIDPNASTVIFVHPQLMMQNPVLKKLILEIDASAPKHQPWRCAEIDELKFIVQWREEKIYQQTNWVEDSTTIMRMIEPVVAKSFYEKLIRHGYREKTEDNITFQFKPLRDFSVKHPFEAFLPEIAKKRTEEDQQLFADKGYVVYKIDDRTVLQSERSIPTFLNVPGIKQSDAKKPIWSEKFDAVATKPIILVANLREIAESNKSQSKTAAQPQAEQAMILALMSVLWEKGDFAIITLDTAEKDMRLKITVFSPNAEAAKQVMGSIEGFRALLRAGLSLHQPKVARFNDPDADKVNEKYRNLVDKLVAQAVVEQQGNESSFVLTVPAEDVEYLATSIAKVIGALPEKKPNPRKPISSEAFKAEVNDPLPDSKTDSEKGKSVSPEKTK